MPILGITASQITGRLAIPDTGAMFPLGMVQVGSAGASSITFSSIPATYTHLQIRGIGRDAGSNGEWKIELNSDTTTTNYRRHGLYGDGSSAAAFGVNNNTVAPMAYSSQTSNTFGAYVTDILDYANTNKNTTIRTLGGYDVNGSGQEGLFSNLWNNTAAVSSITLRVVGGSNFVQYSQFALYGIKGA
jgi:hypothetical protein